MAYFSQFLDRAEKLIKEEKKQRTSTFKDGYP